MQIKSYDAKVFELSDDTGRPTGRVVIHHDPELPFVEIYRADIEVHDPGDVENGPELVEDLVFVWIGRHIGPLAWNHDNEVQCVHELFKQAMAWETVPAEPPTEELAESKPVEVSEAEAKLRTAYCSESYDEFIKDLDYEDQNEEGILRATSSDWLGRFTVEELKRDRIVYIDNGFIYTRLDEMIFNALNAGCDPGEIRGWYTKDPELIKAADKWMAALLNEWEETR